MAKSKTVSIITNIILIIVILTVGLGVAIYLKPDLIDQIPGARDLIQNSPLANIPAVTNALPDIFAKKEDVDEKEEKKEAPEIVVPVKTHLVSRMEFEDTLPVMGTIKAAKEVELKFEVAGRIAVIAVQDGDLASAGELIAQLDDSDAKLKLEYSKSKLKSSKIEKLIAEKKLQVQQDLFEIGAIIKPELENAILEYENAKSRVKTAEKEVEFSVKELEKTRLLSPHEGVIAERVMEIGTLVNPNLKVASIHDVSEVYAEVGIIEKDVERIQQAFVEGREVKVSVDTYPSVEFIGAVETLSPVIEGKTRTMVARVKIVNDNPMATLLPGMFARAQVIVFAVEDALMVPVTALHDTNEDGTNDSVYIVGPESKIKAQLVKLGYVSSDYAQILQGVNVGDEVVTEAQGQLKDGAQVEVLETQESP